MLIVYNDYGCYLDYRSRCNPIRQMTKALLPPWLCTLTSTVYSYVAAVSPSIHPQELQLYNGPVERRTSAAGVSKKY